MATFYDTPSTAEGLPKYYANWDANFWIVAPTPNANYEITLAYVKQPDTLHLVQTLLELTCQINIKIYYYTRL
ncbi:MAG: hypothetical protein CM15mV55_900 [uncultured marine virus]|nr:MAG: hypothetical protein CM15mV55_900 [uncultured marine virus]